MWKKMLTLLKRPEITNQNDSQKSLCSSVKGLQIYAQVSGFPQETSLGWELGRKSLWDAGLYQAVLYPKWTRPLRGKEAGRWWPSSHGLFPWQSPVIEGVHVNHLLCFDDAGRLWFLFEVPLTLQRHSELIQHGTAEWPLNRRRKRKVKLCVNNMHK